jgi:hypothetical protein
VDESFRADSHGHTIGDCPKCARTVASYNGTGSATDTPSTGAGCSESTGAVATDNGSDSATDAVSAGAGCSESAGAIASDNGSDSATYSGSTSSGCSKSSCAVAIHLRIGSATYSDYTTAGCSESTDIVAGHIGSDSATYPSGTTADCLNDFGSAEPIRAAVCSRPSGRESHRGTQASGADRCGSSASGGTGWGERRRWEWTRCGELATGDRSRLIQAVSLGRRRRGFLHRDDIGIDVRRHWR